MPRKTRDLVARGERTAAAWKRCHPRKTFSGLTLDEFIEALKPSREVREELQANATLRRILLQRRRISDSALKSTLMGVVHSVRGDPDVGESDPMYASMGYIPPSRRRKPGRKKKPRATARAGGK